MRSMTGFGRGEATNGHVTVVVELKSVNNRFKDVQLRVPREYNVFEPRLAGLLRDGISRGRLDAFVRRTGVEGGMRVVVDLGLVDQYRRAIADVARRLQRDTGDIDVAQILGQPGVLTTIEADPDVTGEWDLVVTAAEGALADLNTMRDTEGRAMEADLRRHLDELRRLREEVSLAADGVAERLRKKLTDRLQRLIGDRVDPSRLVQEAAILADKADVAEELARLGSHADQFAEAFVASDAVGRKLDFLLQEMNREINTLGSKSAEHPISARVVELKTVLERMREQAANVE